MKRKIALLGGLFDPPHWGHFLVATQLVEIQRDIDEVWLMPAYQHPWRKSVVSAVHRLAMVKKLENSFLRASPLEIDQGRTSFTIDTVRALKKAYPHDFSWIIGSDGVRDFSKWKDAKHLAKEIPFLVFPRAGYPVETIPPNFILINAPNMIVSNLSSTLVRKRVHERKSIVGCVPESVCQYIQTHKLYE